MDYGRFRCRHCRKLRRKRTPDQHYCGESQCQKARKNGWRRAKYATDPDYRANQRDSTRTWLEEQGGSVTYYRAYRRRRKEARPSAKRTVPRRANSDAERGETILESGIYALIPVSQRGDANGDALLAKIDLISRGYGPITNIDSVVDPGA